MESEDELQYEYFPEGGTASGIVAYNKETGKCNIKKLSEEDKHQRYALKMFKRIREFASSDSFQKEGIVAWY
jgi:hypothetical protein